MMRLAPTLTAPYDYEFCTEDADCSNGDVDLEIDIVGECSSDLEIVHLIDLNKDGTHEINGTGIFQGTCTNGSSQRPLSWLKMGVGMKLRLFLILK